MSNVFLKRATQRANLQGCVEYRLLGRTMHLPEPTSMCKHRSVNDANTHSQVWSGTESDRAHRPLRTPPPQHRTASQLQPSRSGLHRCRGHRRSRDRCLELSPNFRRTNGTWGLPRATCAIVRPVFLPVPQRYGSKQPLRNQARTCIITSGRAKRLKTKRCTHHFLYIHMHRCVSNRFARPDAAVWFRSRGGWCNPYHCGPDTNTNQTNAHVARSWLPAPRRPDAAPLRAFRFGAAVASVGSWSGDSTPTTTDYIGGTKPNDYLQIPAGR